MMGVGDVVGLYKRLARRGGVLKFKGGVYIAEGNGVSCVVRYNRMGLPKRVFLLSSPI